MPKAARLWFWVIPYVLLVKAQDLRCPHADNVTLVDDDVLFRDFFPTVNYLKPVGNPQGHQNLTWCCIAAVTEYLRNGCVNTTNVQVDEQILDASQQFPCGAVYAGNLGGAPVVRASYSWTTSRCPGWQVSKASNARQWLQTLVGFLLPSVIFALNVPRGYKVPMKDFLFAKGPIWQELFFACIAILSAIGDTMFWLCIVFAMAGPLLLSGSLEALLDYNVIKYMLRRDKQRDQPYQKNNGLPLALRARILFTILGGNLELATAWKHVMSLAQDLDGLDNPNFDFEPTAVAGEVLSSGVGTQQLFRERIFSFDIEANDTQARPQFSDIVQSQRSLTIPHDMEESVIASDISDQDGEGSILSTDTSLQHTVTQKGRAASDVTRIQRLQRLMKTSNRDSEPQPYDMERLIPVSPAEHRFRRRRSSGKQYFDVAVESETRRADSGTSSRNLAREEELQWDALGRKYLETYKKEKRRKKTVGRIEQRLKAMLACQYSFGSTVGAPVVFYVGSFIYALIEILQAYGDADVSHALAFGSWWMIIPHIATVSGLLLGGNNPNTLGAIIGAKQGSKLQYAFGKPKPNSMEALEEETQLEKVISLNRKSIGARQDGFLETFLDRMIERVYSDSIYTPVSMWERGRSKQTWLLILCADSWSSYDWYDEATLEEFKREIVQFLRETVMLSHVGRIGVISATFLMLFIPCMLGFLTAYYTPQVGVSCRSFTVVVYMVIQALLLVLWGLKMTYVDEYWQHGRHILKVFHDNPETTSGQLNEAFWSLHDLSHKGVTLETTKKKSVRWRYIFQGLIIFLPSVAIFSAIGGTLMQIIGVYRSCFCKFNVTEWIRHHSAMGVLSTNTHQDIVLARHNWLTIGISGTCFMTVTCFSGWWYQKRAKYSFNKLAIRLGEDIQRRCAELDVAVSADNRISRDMAQ